MRTLQNNTTWRRHTGILPGALEGPMKRGALRLRKCPCSDPNTAAMLSLATSWLTCELLVDRDHIFPSCLIRVLGECCDSPPVHLVFSSPMCFFILSPLEGVLFLYPWISTSCPPVDPWFCGHLSQESFLGPASLPGSDGCLYTLCGCLSHLSMGIRTDRCIFSSVTRLQTSGGKGPGFTHLPVLQAQRRVLARLPLRTAAAAVIQYVPDFPCYLNLPAAYQIGVNVLLILQLRKQS